MSTPSIRRVRGADRVACVRVHHAANDINVPMDWYVAARLAHPKKARADWWVREVDGRVVSTLLSYPLRFADGDARFDGYGIGAVSTLPADRRKGHARALLEEVIRYEEGRGRAVGLLFSAIPEAYYARLGFVTCPAAMARCEDPARLAASGAQATLVPLDAREDTDTLRETWHHGHTGLRIARDDDRTWTQTLADNPEDVFFGVEGVDGAYVRLVDDPAELEIVEVFAPDTTTTHAIVRAVAALAVELRRPAVQGWLDDGEVPAGHFAQRSRSRTLPMLRGPADTETARFWASDYF